MWNNGLNNYAQPLKSCSQVYVQRLVWKALSVKYRQVKNRFTAGTRVTVYVHNLPHHYLLDAGLLNSAEYARLLKNSKSWFKLLEEGAYLQKGERKINVNNFHQVWQQILQDSRRGMMIQRYKGLGEMNAEQLWETTMDPENRNMLQVTIDDAIEADRMFSCLMGDDVEPRRAFIEENALNADIDA